MRRHGSWRAWSGDAETSQEAVHRAELPDMDWSRSNSSGSRWSGLAVAANATSMLEVMSVADSDILRSGPLPNLSVVPHVPSGPSGLPSQPSQPSPPPRPLRPPRPRSANSAMPARWWPGTLLAANSDRLYTGDSSFSSADEPNLMLPGLVPLPETVGRCESQGPSRCAPENSLNDSMTSFSSSEVALMVTMPNMPKSGSLISPHHRRLGGLGDPDEVHSLPDLRNLGPWLHRQPQDHNQQHLQTGVLCFSRELVTEELRISAQHLLWRLRGAEAAGARGSGTHQLLRTLTASAEESSQTFLCLVCFENHRASKRLRIAQCKAEGHGCCNDCAANFFKSRIVQGRVFELPCPMGAADGCCYGTNVSFADSPDHSVNSGMSRWAVAMATREEVEACLATSNEKDDILKRYRRFLKTKIDPSLRECPDCNHLCSPKMDPDTGAPESDMRCTKCGSQFCYFHAAAHRGSSCETYEVRLAAETKGISQAFGTKDCPRCGRQTMKSGGCNHMTCHVCRAEWCWICSTHMTQRGPHGEDAVYWHYSDENVESGCQQFTDAGTHPDMEQVRLRRRDRTPGVFMRRISEPVGALSVMLLGIAAILALVFWLILYFVCCWVSELARLVMRGAYRMVGVDRPEHLFEQAVQRLKKSTLYAAVLFGMVAFLVPFFVLTIVWDAVATVLWGCLAALGQIPFIRRFVPATSRYHLKFLASAPLRAVHRFGSALYANMQDERDWVVDDGDMLDA